LELDHEVGPAGGGVSGRNDGSVSRDGRSVRYFQAARPQSGLFVRPDAVQRLDMDSRGHAAAVEGEGNGSSAGREGCNGSDEDLDSAGADGVADGCGPSVFGRTMRLNLAAQEGEAAAVKQLLDERLVEQCTLSSPSPPPERAPAGEQTPTAARTAFALRGAASAESEVERMLARARARARLGSEAQLPAAARAPASQLPRPAVPADTADTASTEHVAGDGDDDHTDASGSGGGGGGTAQQGPDPGAAEVVEASADVCSPPSSTSPSSSASSSSSPLAHQQQVLTRRRQRAEARAAADAEREARLVVYRREAQDRARAKELRCEAE
jgi:hypothetical protein